MFSSNRNKNYMWFIFSRFVRIGVTQILPDKLYLKIAYKIATKKKLNVDFPETFNEKLQWLKLYDHNSQYIRMVDKYAVKQYVTDRGYKRYIIPTLGVWESFSDIDFSKFPEQFVLKCTHDSGGVVICQDKSTFDIDFAKRKLERSLKRNFYYYGREWPYKKVKPKIIAERYLVGAIVEYKFFCFDGHPKFILVCIGEGHGANRTHCWVNLEFENLPFRIGSWSQIKTKVNKPDNFQEMIDFVTNMSKGIPHVRVDLYNVDGKIYFGEFTFFHESGFQVFIPKEWDKKIGELIVLPHKKKM